MLTWNMLANGLKYASQRARETSRPFYVGPGNGESILVTWDRDQIVGAGIEVAPSGATMFFWPEPYTRPAETLYHGMTEADVLSHAAGAVSRHKARLEQSERATEEG